MAEGWSQLKRPDGTSYTAYGKWAPWKQWADSLRNYVEANRVNLTDQKKDIDIHTDRLNRLNERVTALEEAPQNPFPASG